MYPLPSYKSKIQLPLEQRRFEQRRSINMQIFSINTVNGLSPYAFLNKIFFSLAYFIVRIQYIIHITQKICVNRLVILSMRLPVNSSY